MEPLPEDLWDDDTRALVQTNWFSDRPAKGQNFFKTMVRHRELFRVWNEFGRTVFKGRLPDRDRELLILRTAWLTRCRFEWAHHQPLVERLGMSAQEIRRITRGPDAGGWSELDAALLRAVDELHTRSDIGDATWKVLRAHYDDAELIEIPVVVGQYHLVAFFNNAFGVEVDARLPSLPEPP
jgi:alkylhydroperoxidase family enzyme